MKDVVLVGWSYGGMVISNVLARVPDKITSIVYLDAFIPDPGRSMVSYAYSGDEYRRIAEMAAANQDVPVPGIGFMVTPEMVEYVQAGECSTDGHLPAALAGIGPATQYTAHLHLGGPIPRACLSPILRAVQERAHG